ncbi:hypothetical protein T4E_8507 [Trichinella pseudospiralis]|uniref:Uncharacterized protein n=1 Tax=Trichinella pseudospiralis TaxID=6337 RepID=A0A0V0XUJ3_TRIPS|nr:hypothetical protein T4E_8507 [Trichinella pseudospiralis]
MLVHWVAQMMTVSSKVEIKRLKLRLNSLISCALVTPNSLEAGTEKITEGEPDMGNGNLEEWRGSLVDRAECSQQGKRTLRGVLLRCRKANSRGERDLRRMNLVQYYFEMAGT